MITEAIKTQMNNHLAAWDMFAGHEGGTEEDYLNSGLAASVTGMTIPVDAGHLLLPGLNQAVAQAPTA